MLLTNARNFINFVLQNIKIQHKIEKLGEGNHYQTEMTETFLY